MNLTYKGINENNNYRHTIIGNIKDSEIDVVEGHLYNEGIEYDMFDDIGNKTVAYIEVSDKDEHEHFKDTIYKEIKKLVKSIY